MLCLQAVGVFTFTHILLSDILGYCFLLAILYLVRYLLDSSVRFSAFNDDFGYVRSGMSSVYSVYDIVQPGTYSKDNDKSISI